MLRPYLAVIKDSFREALASRVLWVLLALVVFLLVLLSGLDLAVTRQSELIFSDVRNPVGLADALVAAGGSNEPSLAKRLWQGLPEPLQTKLRGLGERGHPPGHLPRVVQELRKAINTRLRGKELYDAAIFDGLPLDEEAQGLRKKGVASLSDEDRLRLNRLALDAELRDLIAPAGEGTVRFRYFGWELDEPTGIRPEEIETTVQQTVFTLMQFLVRRFGIFISILVTAPIVPRMFNSGEVDLLFSKPVSRSLLFLTKFVGGCAFALLLTGTFVVGVWLIVGLRFGFWSIDLLLTIPVFLFVFAVYYSVSAAVGVVYRNTVLAVGLTVLFWFVCWTIGNLHDFGKLFLFNGKQAQEVLSIGDDLLVAQKSGDVQRWSAERETWEPVFAPAVAEMERVVASTGFFYPLDGPHPLVDGFVAVEKRGRDQQFSFLGKVLFARRDDGYDRVTGSGVPNGTLGLVVHPRHGVLAVGPSVLSRLEVAPDGAAGEPVLTAPADPAAATFVDRRPQSAEWGYPYAAAVNSSDGRLAVFERGRLHLLRDTADGTWEVVRSRDGLGNEAALVGFSSEGIIVADRTGRVRFLTPDTLEDRTTIAAGEDCEPRAVRMSPDGRTVVVLFHQRELLLAETATGKELALDVQGADDVTAVAFAADGGLLVADRYPRVTRYDLVQQRATQTWESNDTLTLVFLYLLRPLHSVFPIPADLDAAAQYLMTSSRSAAVRDRSDLTEERLTVDVWGPVWRNLAFLSVVLALTCVYISRKDF